MCSVPAASARTNPVDSASAPTSDSSALVSFFKVLPFSLSLRYFS